MLIYEVKKMSVLFYFILEITSLKKKITRTRGRTPVSYFSRWERINLISSLERQIAEIDEIGFKNYSSEYFKEQKKNDFNFLA